MSVRIRAATAADADAIEAIFRAVTAAGDTYVYDAAMPSPQLHRYWLDEGVACFVACDGDAVLGMYRLVPNQPGRGAHVANAAFMVAPSARGRGIGRRLGEDCLERARVAGYRAMQFNFVVATNRPALQLWQELGFAIVGTLPKVFRHATLGEVDAYVMHRFL
jgi:GNAT superfamily N-acetyltransferase